MKVAISSQGKSFKSKIDPRFVRARFFVIVDTETGDLRTVKNTRALVAHHGMGIDVAKFVAEEGVDYVLTGKCAPKALLALNMDGIRVALNMKGTVGEALERFKKTKMRDRRVPA